MKKKYLSLLYFSLAFGLSAQEVLWQKDISSSTQDILSVMTFTIDRHILLSGSSINQKNQQHNNGYDYRIVKLSQNGDLLWEKYYGGTKNDYLSSLTATQEGGFLLAGTSFSHQSNDKKENNAGGSDVWIIRLDENGEELWQKTLGTKSNDEASTVVQSTDNGFFVAGNISSNDLLFGSKDVFISKLDESGKLLQTTILGGESIDEITNMIPTPDDGAVLVIYSASGKSGGVANPENLYQENNKEGLISSVGTFSGKTEDSFGEGDYWIVKIDKDANVEWQKTYGGKGDDHPKTIAFTDSGYLIGGESRSDASGNKKEDAGEGTDLWLISLDHNGNELWQKSYSFGNRGVLMSMDVIRKTGNNNQSTDKGFLLGGYTQAEETVKRDDEKFWILYIDTNGNEEWRKYVEGNSKKKQERLVSAKLQNDGTYLLAGTSAEKTGSENWKIVKLADKQLDELIEQHEIRIYPNPSEDYCYVEIGFAIENNEEAEILLHDMSGRRIQSVKTRNTVTKINTGILPPGVYIVTVKTSKKSVNSKLVKK